MQWIHVQISVTVNESNSSWSDVRGTESFDFDVPADLFDAKRISNIFPNMIKVAEEKYALEKQKAELEPDEGEE